MKLLILLLLLSSTALGQVTDWSFTSAQCRVKDSTMAKKRLIDTTFDHVAHWACNTTTRTITMTLPDINYTKRWKYDSVKVQTRGTAAETGQYYYLHQRKEQDVMLIIYYPRLNKIIEIGVENGKQLRAKYESN